jgi:hypothetical protein
VGTANDEPGTLLVIASEAEDLLFADANEKAGFSTPQDRPHSRPIPLRSK